MELHPPGIEMPEANAVLAQMDEMKIDMKEIRSSISKIAEALTRLAVLEEKSHSHAATLERVVLKVDRIEERQRDAETIRDVVARNTQRIEMVEAKAEATKIGQIEFNAEVKGITKTIKVMWTAFGAGVLYLGSQLYTFLSTMPKK